MRVLLTGGSGFLGQHVAEALAFRGHDVIAVARASSNTTRLEAIGARIVRADLSSARSLASSLSGPIDAVVHAAGGGRVGASTDLYAQNAGTTVALLDALDLAAITPSRFVLVSSQAAGGPALSPAGRPDDAPDRPLSDYGKSKLAAEREALARSPRMAVTVVRPPSVYGPGDDRFFGLFRAASRGVVPLLLPDGVASVISGPDCARAICDVVEKPHPTGRVYAVCEPAPLSMWRMGRVIGEAMGKVVLPLPVPRAALPVAGAVGEALARARGGVAFMSRDKARDGGARFWVSSGAAIERELGFVPSWSFCVDGARRTLAWYQAERWL